MFLVVRAASFRVVRNGSGAGLQEEAYYVLNVVAMVFEVPCGSLPITSCFELLASEILKQLKYRHDEKRNGFLHKTAGFGRGFPYLNLSRRDVRRRWRNRRFAEPTENELLADGILKQLKYRDDFEARNGFS